MNTALAIFVGGGFGSLARYGVSRLVSTDSMVFPWATLFANILASALLAFVVFKWQDSLSGKAGAYPLLAIGFCGGFSTFSTFSLENFQLLKQGDLLTASLNVVVSILCCLAVFYFIAQRS